LIETLIWVHLAETSEVLGPLEFILDRGFRLNDGIYATIGLMFFEDPKGIKFGKSHETRYFLLSGVS